MSSTGSIDSNTINGKKNRIGKSSFKKASTSRKNKKSVKFDENQESVSESDSNNEIPNLKAANSSSLKKNFSLPEIKGSLKNESLNIPSGYPSKRMVPTGSDQNLIQKKGKNKSSIVGSIKERIQNAIKQSQNDRYNREALDDLGDMEFKIAQSNVKDNEIPAFVPTEDKEDLQRADIRLKPQIMDSLSELGGDYHVSIKDVQRKSLPKVLTDEERYSMDYMIVNKKEKKKQTGWKNQSNPSFKISSKFDLPNAQNDQPILSSRKADNIESERVKLPDPTIQEINLSHKLEDKDHIETEEIK